MLKKGGSDVGTISNRAEATECIPDEIGIDAKRKEVKMVGKQKHVFLVVLLLSLLPIFVSAQWLETTITVGDFPGALVYNPTNNKVYCANEGSANVTVIDGATNGVITTIGVGSSPCALVYNPTNNKVYCANWGPANVTVIDGATNGVITTIAVGVQPRAFAWNYARNRTYVANCASSTVSVIRDVVGIEEDKTSIVESNDVGATIFSGPLLLPKGNKCQVFDITGRVVEPDKIQPGIYFIEVDGVVTQKVVKVR